MKLKNILFALLASAAFISAQSCLKEQRDLFPKSSSERLQEYADNLSKTLVSAEKGWIMEYYPGKGQARGGYAYYIKFSEAEAEVSYEREPNAVYKSFYKLTFDNGAVLSFDTNNPAMHYYATPSSGEYQAKGGDFEFSVLSISDEKVSLLGKRSGNRYDLTRYDSDLKPAEYLKAVEKMAGSMSAAIIEGKIGDKEVNGNISFKERKITFRYDDKYQDPKTQELKDTTYTVSTAYMYTPEGIHMYNEVKVAGATLRDMQYHAGNNILTNGSVVFYGKLPEYYTPKAAWPGEYTMVYDSQRSITIEFDPEDPDGMLMHGLNPEVTVKLGYDPSQGVLTWEGQIVGMDGANSIALIALNESGSLYPYSDYLGIGMIIRRNVETGNFDFIDNEFEEKPDDFGKADGWCYWLLTPEGRSAGQYRGFSPGFFQHLKYLTRK